MIFLGAFGSAGPPLSGGDCLGMTGWESLRTRLAASRSSNDGYILP